ncbi:unnamed protein product [Lupinus luteus]|uniref:Uncharacterized protein n=1 Tax=Lupinus luteus TaxID=3873 RepID=A0AAV1Y2L0_LUPLU
MISFQEVLAESSRAKVQEELEASTKKRKWEEPYAREFFKNQTNLEERKSTLDIDFNLETPFISDNWRHYLTIQTGQIHICEDSKRSTEPLPHHHMSLELGLNLTPESLWNNEEDNSYDMIENQSYSNSLGTLLELDHDDMIIETNKHKKDTSYDLIHSSPSWLSSSSEGDYKEMVATVCMQCHMLVMLCKSSPTCPSCKFMHPPPDQNPSNFIKRRSNLFC